MYPVLFANFFLEWKRHYRPIGVRSSLQALHMSARKHGVGVAHSSLVRDSVFRLVLECDWALSVVPERNPPDGGIVMMVLWQRSDQNLAH